MMLGAGKPRTGRPEKGSYREGRDKKLCVRVSDSDINMLNRICEAYQITKSDFIIMSIKEGFSKL